MPTTGGTIEAVRDATGIFMTGGNQLRLSSVIGGTGLGRAIIDRHRHGVIVAGTSAGASAISTHMVSFGTSGATPKQRMTQMSAGLGLLPGVIIDQHFEQRNRHRPAAGAGRPVPALLGMGIDEDTAALVSPAGMMEVLGKGSVTILDPAKIQTDAYEVKRHKPIMVSGVDPPLAAIGLSVRPSQAAPAGAAPPGVGNRSRAGSHRQRHRPHPAA